MDPDLQSELVRYLALLRKARATPPGCCCNSLPASDLFGALLLISLDKKLAGKAGDLDTPLPPGLPSIQSEAQPATVDDTKSIFSRISDSLSIRGLEFASSKKVEARLDTLYSELSTLGSLSLCNDSTSAGQLTNILPLHSLRALRHLRIESLHPFSFSGWNDLSLNLVGLSFVHCAIQDCSVLAALSDLPAAWDRLRHLSLERNDLLSLSFENMEIATRLTSLNVSSNQLIDLPNPLPVHLKSLNISGNMIRSLLPLYTLKELETFNARANRIRNLVGLEKCQKLLRLDLRGNDITNEEFSRIVWDRQEGCKSLTDLWVDEVNEQAAKAIASLERLNNRKLRNIWNVWGTTIQNKDLTVLPSKADDNELPPVIKVKPRRKREDNQNINSNIS